MLKNIIVRTIAHQKNEIEFKYMNAKVSTKVRFMLKILLFLTILQCLSSCHIGINSKNVENKKEKIQALQKLEYYKNIELNKESPMFSFKVKVDGKPCLKDTYFISSKGHLYINGVGRKFSRIYFFNDSIAKVKETSCETYYDADLDYFFEYTWRYYLDWTTQENIFDGKYYKLFSKQDSGKFTYNQEKMEDTIYSTPSDDFKIAYKYFKKYAFSKSYK